MAAAEAAPASLGPSFAPEDPTLPKPWKGLIDGSTGVLYYWNPETNVTQYERPAGSAPPLPAGLPPSTSPHQVSPSPSAQNTGTNDSLALQTSGQQIHQQPHQPQIPIQQPIQQMPLQQLQQLPYQQLQPTSNQQPMHISQQPSNPAQHYSQFHQMPYQQIPYRHPQGQFPYQPGQNAQAFHFQYQHGQQLQGSEVPQHLAGPQPQESQAGQLSGQQSQGSQSLQQNSHSTQNGHQQGMPFHVHQFSTQQQILQQGQRPPQQHLQQIGFPGKEDAVRQEGQLNNHQLPGLNRHDQIPQTGANVIQTQPQHQLGGPSPINPQQAAINQLHRMSSDSSHHQMQTGKQMFSNQVGPSMVHPPLASQPGYEDGQHERGGNELYSAGRAEGPVIHPSHPKLAPLPLPQNQQDVRRGSMPPKFLSAGQPDGSNILPGHAMPNTYGHAPFPNATPTRPPPRIFGPPDSLNLSAADAYRQHHEVTAVGENIPSPFMTFEATGFPPEILREMHAAGFSSPTPIQAQTWPIALQSRDIVAIAKTGSGKTLGYLIPAFIHLRRCRNNPQFGPTILILAPTRELATQIQDEAIKFGHSSRISCTCLYGGAPKGPQLKEIDRGVDIIVATPGRLNDILEMGRINFRQVSFLVLDEADRMLDMGFELQIRKIVNEIPKRRQTLMYTATWPVEVRKIAGDLLVDPVQVNIGSVDELVANKSITQYVETLSPMDKQRRLEQILRSQERGSKVIIFCSTKKLCDQLARSIGRPFGAIAIHGDKSQPERDHVLNQFRTGRCPILVATDVAARGLDIKDIRVVINYDFPSGIEDYVHRIGRTGRAGATGVSYTFFTDQDWKHATELIKVLEGANQRVPPEIRDMASRAGPPSQRFSSQGGMSRWDSNGGNGGGHMDSGGGGRGMKEYGRGGGGRGFVGRGGRSDFYGGGRGGPASRGRGYAGGSWGRHDRGGPRDRFHSSDGRGRLSGRRGFSDRTRDRSYSRSPERGRTWGHGRSRSPSWSRSRSPSWSRSRSRSWSRSRSFSRSPSRSRSYDRNDRPPARRRVSGFDVPLSNDAVAAPQDSRRASGFDAPPSLAPSIGDRLPESDPPQATGFSSALTGQMSPLSPAQDSGTFSGAEPGNQPAGLREVEALQEPCRHLEGGGL